MLNYIFLLLFIAIGIYQHKKKKYMSAILIYSIIAPCIKIGNMSFDSSYLFLGFFFMYYIFSCGKIEINNNQKYVNYFIGAWIVLFTIGWIFSGAVSSKKFLISILGLMKTLLAVYLCHIYGKYEKAEDLDIMIGKGIEISVYLNAVMVILQVCFPAKMFNLCYYLYYSSNSSGYTSLDSIGTWGGVFFKDHFIRYSGLFETPMLLASFLSFIITFVYIQKLYKRNYFKYPNLLLILCLTVGIMTQCKIFFLMLPIHICAYLWLSRKSINIKTIGISIVVIFMCLTLASIDIESIEFLSSSIGNKLQYLKDPLSAFKTRFGGNDESGFLTETINVVKENIITGVGPVSVNGEAIADSSYVVILHNGGIFSLVAMILFYINMWKSNIKISQSYLNTLIIMILFIGISRTVLVSGSILIVLLYYLTENVYISVHENRN